MASLAEIELCRQTVDLLNRMKPRPAFFIVCGDLVDAFPDKWPEIRAAQERDFFKVFSKLDKDIPLVCVCGNHDVGEYSICLSTFDACFYLTTFLNLVTYQFYSV